MFITGAQASPDPCVLYQSRLITQSGSSIQHRPAPEPRSIRALFAWLALAFVALRVIRGPGRC